MSRGGMIDRMLDSIPGYGGYRDKERRRDSDRAIRENLALEYGQLASRLGRLATKLADERKIMAISTVDKPQKRLTSFIDRVRTASYGYAPLFSDKPVDATALDQIALFDRALADQLSTLATQIETLEQTNPDDEAFKSTASEISTTVDGLHDRFDKRHEVIQSGTSLPSQDVAKYLDPAQHLSEPAAYRLHEHEAVSYDGVNYTVAGRVSVETVGSAWRAFKLKGGAGDVWLLVSSDSTSPTYWTQRSSVAVQPGAETVSDDTATYNLVSVVKGKGDVFGPSGSADNQPVELAQYRATSGEARFFTFSWGTGGLSLKGGEANPASLDVFTRET